MVFPNHSGFRRFSAKFIHNASTKVDLFNCYFYTLHMKKTKYRQEDSLGYMTITAHRLLNSTLRRKFKEAEIDVKSEQWGVLILLWERGSATQDELATALCVDKSSMSRILSVMEDCELIVRIVDPENERKKNVHATQRANVLREQGFAIASDVLTRSLEGVSEEDTATCLRVLGAVKHNLRNKYG